MSPICQKPDDLRFNQQIRRDLNVLADFENPRRLKITKQGFKSVSRVHALFQSLKGKIGLTNACASTLVNYHARKVLYEVHLAGIDNFSDTLELIKENQALHQQHKKIATLFKRNVRSVETVKQDLIQEYTEIRPSFWRRHCTHPAHFDPNQFGVSSLYKSMAGISQSDGIHYFSNLLNMNLTDQVTTHQFRSSFGRYLENRTIPVELRADVAAIKMKIALAQFRVYRLNDDHREIVRQFDVKNWPQDLTCRLFDQLMDCGDVQNFIALYRKAVEADFPREVYRPHFINLALIHRTERFSLVTLAFEDATSDEVTHELANAYFTLYPSRQYRLQSFFRIRQKAPQALGAIIAPWDAFTTSEEVLTGQNCCLNNEDLKELFRVYRDRSRQEAFQMLESISVLKKITFQANSIRENALNKFRIGFLNAETDEYHATWLTHFLTLLSENKSYNEEFQKAIRRILVRSSVSDNIELLEFILAWTGRNDSYKDELQKTIRRILARCNRSDNTELLEFILPWTNLEMIAEYGNSLGAYLERLPLHKDRKLELIDKLLKICPHPYLYFLKGEWLSSIKEKERLETYLWAYTLSPGNSMAPPKKKFYERACLIDKDATVNDIDLYRTLAIEAGCKPKS